MSDIAIEALIDNARKSHENLIFRAAFLNAENAQLKEDKEKLIEIIKPLLVERNKEPMVSSSMYAWDDLEKVINEVKDET